MIRPIRPGGAAGSDDDRDNAPVTLPAWIAADLLRVLHHSRDATCEQHPCFSPLATDLDYHAGLLVRRLQALNYPTAMERYS